jgi:hypothetical protein
MSGSLFPSLRLWKQFGHMASSYAKGNSIIHNLANMKNIIDNNNDIGSGNIFDGSTKPRDLLDFSWKSFHDVADYRRAENAIQRGECPRLACKEVWVDIQTLSNTEKELVLNSIPWVIRRNPNRYCDLRPRNEHDLLWRTYTNASLSYRGYCVCDKYAFKYCRDPINPVDCEII